MQQRGRQNVNRFQLYNGASRGHGGGEMTRKLVVLQTNRLIVSRRAQFEREQNFLSNGARNPTSSEQYTHFLDYRFCPGGQNGTFLG